MVELKMFGVRSTLSLDGSKYIFNRTEDKSIALSVYRFKFTIFHQSEKNNGEIINEYLLIITSIMLVIDRMCSLRLQITVVGKQVQSNKQNKVPVISRS